MGKYYENDCPVAMRKMVKYCKRCSIVAKGIRSNGRFHRPKTHAGVMKGREKWTCYIGSESVKCHNTRTTAAGTLQHQMQCKDCHKYYTISHKSYVDYKDWRREQENKLRGDFMNYTNQFDEFEHPARSSYTSGATMHIVKVRWEIMKKMAAHEKMLLIYYPEEFTIQRFCYTFNQRVTFGINGWSVM